MILFQIVYSIDILSSDLIWTDHLHFLPQRDLYDLHMSNDNSVNK